MYPVIFTIKVRILLQEKHIIIPLTLTLLLESNLL